MFLRRKFLNHAVQDELADIQDNLSQLLSTRRGTGYFLPQFGVTDTGYRTPAEMAERLGQEIQENVRLFEPRLAVLEIDEDYQDDGSVRLHVYCRVVSDDQRMRIVMDGRGRLLRLGVGEDYGEGVGTPIDELD